MPYPNRQALEMFVRDTDVLLAGNFAKQVQEGIRTGIRIANGRLESVTLQGPTDDAVGAYLLTARMFGQNNDEISFHNISKRIANIAVPQALKNLYEQSRTNLNAYLDSPLIVPVDGANAPTNRVLFDTFLYGIYAHRNAEKAAIIAHWQQAAFYPDLHAQFYFVAHEFLRAASAMADAVREILRTHF